MQQNGNLRFNLFFKKNPFAQLLLCIHWLHHFSITWNKERNEIYECSKFEGKLGNIRITNWKNKYYAHWWTNKMTKKSINLPPLFYVNFMCNIIRSVKKSLNLKANYRNDEIKASHYGNWKPFEIIIFSVKQKKKQTYMEKWLVEAN